MGFEPGPPAWQTSDIPLDQRVQKHVFHTHQKNRKFSHLRTFAKKLLVPDESWCFRLHFGTHKSLVTGGHRWEIEVTFSRIEGHFAENVFKKLNFLSNESDTLRHPLYFLIHSLLDINACSWSNMLQITSRISSYRFLNDSLLREKIYCDHQGIFLKFSIQIS